MEMFDGGFFRSLEVDWAVGGIEEEFVRFGEQLARYHFVQITKIGHQLIIISMLSQHIVKRFLTHFPKPLF